MKKLLLIFLVITWIAGFNSCSKDSPAPQFTVYQVPVDIAARYIALAFCSASEGINAHVEKAASFTAQGMISFDSTFTAKKLDSATVKYNYEVEYPFVRVNTTPPQVTFDYTARGSFSAATLQSQDEQDANTWVITTLDQAQLTLNGSGTDGGQQYASAEKVLFSSNIIYAFKNVMIDKLTYMIVSGTATIRITGSGPGGVAFNYSGTLTFTGNRHAVLVLGGSTYNLSLSSGSVSK
jgi:hypothetical protein